MKGKGIGILSGFAVLILFILYIVFSGGSELVYGTFESGVFKQNINDGYSTSYQTDTEKIQIIKKRNKTYITSTVKIDSLNALLEHEKKISERIKILESKKESDKKVYGVVTFKNPLSEYEVLSILNESNIAAHAVEYISYPEGVGIHPWPISDNDRTLLKDLEKSIIEHMKILNEGPHKDKVKNKTNMRPINNHNFGDFKLIDGYITIYITGYPKDIIKLSKNPKVYVVDVGPIELLNNYPDAAIYPSKGIYYEYKKYNHKQKNNRYHNFTLS